MKSWAEKEVEFACENAKDGEWDYGGDCYYSALKAFNSLIDDGHSGTSINFTMQILNRLVEGKPLTAITGSEDEWSLRNVYNTSKCKLTRYQNIRMFSLFKDVYSDGTVKYRDCERVICKSADKKTSVSWSNGFITRIIDELYPITMPYYPTLKPYVAYISEFLTDPKNGDFDTIGVLWLTTPGGEKVDVNRYFKESNNDWQEIDADEYTERARMLQK